jgi:integrase/recombinase XerD
MLELFYATGIRRTEMTNLDHGDYDPAARTLIVRKGKAARAGCCPSANAPPPGSTATWPNPARSSTTCPRNRDVPQRLRHPLTPAYLGNWIKKLLKRCGIDKPGSCHLFATVRHRHAPRRGRHPLRD